MTTRHIALVCALLAAGAVAVTLQPREKSRVTNTSPEYLEKRAERAAYMEQAQNLLAAGQGAEAETLLKKAQAVYPGGRSPELEAGLAEAAFLQGRTEEAVERYRAAVAEFGEGDAELLLQYGRMCDRAGLTDEAVAAYRRAFAVQDPDSFPVTLPDGASDADVRRLALEALGVYRQEPPE